MFGQRLGAAADDGREGQHGVELVGLEFDRTVEEVGGFDRVGQARGDGAVYFTRDLDHFSLKFRVGFKIISINLLCSLSVLL